MTRPRRLQRAAPQRTASPDIPLAHVLAALETRSDLSPTRLRDLRSAVKRVAALLREDPSVILLDLPQFDDGNRQPVEGSGQGDADDDQCGANRED